MMLSEVALWTRGTMHGSDVRIGGVTIDSRSAGPGDLFVALPGEHTDGHAHVADAAARGAVAALVARRVEVDLPQVRVADVQAALADLASARRARSDARVVGITGSNGKTTVKNLLGSILALHGPTHVSGGNHNNEIGLPLALLAMPEDTAWAVFEMGAGKPGDIAWLAAIARPHVGLVNNVAPAHLERMKTLEGVAATKGAIYEALPPEGIAVINADDAFAEYFRSLAGRHRVVSFALEDAAADVHARAVMATAQGSRFRLVTPQGETEISLALPGRHNVGNALAAAAVAFALEVPLATIAAGLAAARPVPGRLETRDMPGGWRLVDDTYNANPASLAAALAALAGMGGEPWLVLGDMGELGADAAARHVEAGRLACAAGIARLWAVGPLSAGAVTAFGAGARHFPDVASLTAALRGELHAGVTCLVKGSRAAGMERVVRALRADEKWGDRHVA